MEAQGGELRRVVLQLVVVEGEAPAALPVVLVAPSEVELGLPPGARGIAGTFGPDRRRRA